ncbi:hypothetical protein MMC29_005972, partial [Sticta canariensis]|nr:hypothetical protein [Sticta canariensis]
MAGHNNSLLIDPSLVKYHELNVHRHKHFRWTGRTAWITFTYVVVVPTIVGFMAYKTD